MKKGLLVCAAVLVMAGLVAAPATAATKFNLGVKAGVSIANNAWDDDDGSEHSLVKPTFGIFGVYNLSPNFGIQPEVNFLMTGEWWLDSFEGTEFKDVEIYSYLHIPILAKYRFGAMGKVTPVVFAGPAIGFLLSAHSKSYENGVLTDDTDIKSFFKDTDFGVDFGAGAEFPIGKIKVLVDARYYLGLTNAVPSKPTWSMKSRSFIFTAGIIL